MKVQRFDLVQISRGGVTHTGNYGVTLCGKSYDSGTAIYTATDDVTCKSCIKIEARKAEVEAAIVRNAQLVDELEAQLHPKVQEVDLEALAETATLLHEANAHSEDRARSASDSRPYMTSKRIMLKAIMDAYPALCPSDVYEVRMDGGDPIKWCVKSIVSGQLPTWGGRGGQCPDEIGCMLCLASAARVPTEILTHLPRITAREVEASLAAYDALPVVKRPAVSWRGKRKGSKAKRQLSHA